MPYVWSRVDDFKLGKGRVKGTKWLELRMNHFISFTFIHYVSLSISVPHSNVSDDYSARSYFMPELIC
jgi:hypothetical protein